MIDDMLARYIVPHDDCGTDASGMFMEVVGFCFRVATMREQRRRLAIQPVRPRLTFEYRLAPEHHIRVRWRDLLRISGKQRSASADGA